MPARRRPLLPLLAVLACGALAGCGSAKLLPGDEAARIDDALGRVADRAAAGDCAGATKALEEATSAFGDLPTSVDTKLRQRIADGLSKLTGTVPAECRRAAAGGTTTPADTTPADTAPADTTPADTTPADTTPADTTPADTTPADTTPTPPADTTPTTPVDPGTPPGQGGTPPGQGGTPPGQSPAGGVSPDTGATP